MSIIFFNIRKLIIRAMMAHFRTTEFCLMHLTLRLLFLLVVATGCCRIPSTYDVYGADEFVIDSYRIRQGKFAILEMEGLEVSALDESLMDEYIDRVAEDDILKIGLFHPSRVDLVRAVEEINRTIGFRVVNGQILLPDLPPVRVAGLTLDETRTTLERAYVQEVSHVEVFVDYKERLARAVELVGPIKVSSIPVDGKIRLYEVLAKAGLPNEANLFMSYVVRDGKALSVDLYKLMKEGDMAHNIVMRGHDKIFVASPYDSNAMVMGEVAYPLVVPLPRGSMSLREAIVAAGGIPFTGDKGCIQVIRGNITQPKIYVLNWNHIIHLPNHSLLLMPGDTVYISEKPITKWNRFIDQLLPSFGGAITVQATRTAVGV